MVAEGRPHDENAPCVVFEDVPGTLAGSRVLVNFFGGKRKNMTLGFPTDLVQARAQRGVPRHYMADAQAHPAALRQRRRRCSRT